MIPSWWPLHIWGRPQRHTEFPQYIWGAVTHGRGHWDGTNDCFWVRSCSWCKLSRWKVLCNTWKDLSQQWLKGSSPNKQYPHLPKLNIPHFLMKVHYLFLSDQVSQVRLTHLLLIKLQAHLDSVLQARGTLYPPLLTMAPLLLLDQGRWCTHLTLPHFSCSHKMVYQQLQHTAISHQMSNLQGSKNNLTRKHWCLDLCMLFLRLGVDTHEMHGYKLLRIGKQLTWATAILFHSRIGLENGTHYLDKEPSMINRRWLLWSSLIHTLLHKIFAEGVQDQVSHVQVWLW